MHPAALKRRLGSRVFRTRPRVSIAITTREGLLRERMKERERGLQWCRLCGLGGVRISYDIGNRWNETLTLTTLAACNSRNQYLLRVENERMKNHFSSHFQQNFHSSLFEISIVFVQCDTRPKRRQRTSTRTSSAIVCSLMGGDAQSQSTDYVAMICDLESYFVPRTPALHCPHIFLAQRQTTAADQFVATGCLSCSCCVCPVCIALRPHAYLQMRLSTRPALP